MERERTDMPKKNAQVKAKKISRSEVKPPASKRWWTPEEMIRIGAYPFGRTNLYRSLKNGTIPSVRVGKKYVIPISAFNAWLDSCGGVMKQLAQ